MYIDPRPTDADSFACRYFFYKDGGGNRFHNGHLKKKIHEITKRTELVDEDELEITVDGQEGNLGSQTMAMLLYQRTGLALKSKNIRKNYRSKTQHKNVVSKTLGQLPRMSPAEKVISSLSSRQDVSLVYLVAKVQLGEKLLTTCTKKKKKKQSKPERKLKTTFESNIVSNGGDIITRPATSSELTAASKLDGGDADSPEDTAKAIYNSLGIEENTEILLVIGWCTDRQRRLLALFPESL